jgi:hypothetical protein
VLEAEVHGDERGVDVALAVGVGKRMKRPELASVWN